MRRSGRGIADDEEGDVHVLSVLEDRVGFEFDGFASGEDDFSAVEFFLEKSKSGSRRLVSSRAGCMREQSGLTSFSLSIIKILV